MTEENTLDKIDFAPPGFKVSPGWRVGHLREETFTKSGLLVPAGSEKTSEALPLIDVDSGNQFCLRYFLLSFSYIKHKKCINWRRWTGIEPAKDFYTFQQF